LRENEVAYDPREVMDKDDMILIFVQRITIVSDVVNLERSSLMSILSPKRESVPLLPGGGLTASPSSNNKDNTSSLEPS
jgi:hypothetical protein